MFGNVCLGTYVWECVLGNVCLGMCAWERMFENVCLGDCAWELMHADSAVVLLLGSMLCAAK